MLENKLKEVHLCFPCERLVECQQHGRPGVHRPLQDQVVRQIGLSVAITIKRIGDEAQIFDRDAACADKPHKAIVNGRPIPSVAARENPRDLGEHEERDEDAVPSGVP